MSVDLPKLALVFAGSVTVLLQTLVEKKDGWDFFWIWALVVSSLSTLACLPALALVVCRPPAPGERQYSPPALLLAILWTAGAAPLTMERPFALTGNGYFGTWAALMYSWLMAFAEYPRMKEPLDQLAGGGGAYLAVLLIASLTALLQTTWSCATAAGWCNGNAAWVLVCSAVSTALCSSLLTRQVAEKLQEHFRVVALFFLVWWSAGSVVTTFERPYENSYANGYFSCWVALGTSLLLVESSWDLSVSDAALSRASEVTGGAPPEILVLFAASLVTLTAAAIDCAEVGCGGFVRWAIVCSAGSLTVCFTMLVYTVRGGWITGGTTLVGRVAVVLFAWWVLGTGCMTFESPFLQLGNGFFAAWAALVAAYLFAVKNVTALRSRMAEIGSSGKDVGALLLASAVLFAQAVWDMAGEGSTGGRAWALICSATSLLGISLVVFAGKLQDQFRLVVLGLFLWWCIGVATMTFHAPYVRTGNGYFACWFACGASGRLLLQQFPRLSGYADLGGLSTPTGGSRPEGLGAGAGDSKPPEAALDTDAIEVSMESLDARAVVMGSPFTDPPA